MSLPPQRLASIGLVCVAVGGFAWSEFSGTPIGPASASAASQAAGADGQSSETDEVLNIETSTDCRVVLAGMLRSYAGEHELDAEQIDDPFVEPASWTVVPVVVNTPAQAQQVATASSPAALVLSAVMDSPSGAVARVNGVLLVVGREVEIPGVGLVELIEAGLDGRSAVIKTDQGESRVRLNEVIGVSGG